MLLSTFLSYLLLYRYSMVFLCVFISTIFFVLPIPTDIILFAVGSFVSQGYFTFSTALLVAVTANVLGDIIDYFLARRVGMHRVYKRYSEQYSFFLRLERFVMSHARSTIFLTRFVGVLGPLTNFLCGFLPIPFERFILYSIAGNLTEIAALLYLGFLAGNAWGDFSELLTTVELILFLVLIINTLRTVLKSRREEKKQAASHS